MLHYMGTFYLKKIAESRVPQGFSYFNGSKFGLGTARTGDGLCQGRAYASLFKP